MAFAQETDTLAKRRLLSQNDEEIIDEIDCRVDGRIGWPRPLPVLPLVLDQAVDESYIVADIDEARRHVANVLKAQHVVWDGRYYFAYHHKYDCTPAADDISLIIPSVQSTAVYWVQALKEIRKYFITKGIHYSIEFIDFDAMHPAIYTVLPDNPVVDLWNTIYREKVLTAIRGKAWKSVNVFHRGFADSREECPVTVMIRAWDAEDDEWWNSIIPVLKSTSLFKIHLLGARSITHTGWDCYRSARPLLLEDFLGPLNIGANIGTRGGTGGGTLGGVIEIEWPDKSRSSFGLTNHHVVLEEQLLKETQNNTAFTPDNRLAQDAKLSLSSPCDADTAEEIREIEDRISFRNKLVHGDEAIGNIGLQKKVDSGDDSAADTLQKALESIASLEAEKKQIASSDRLLGHVVASSGYRAVANDGFSWGMDWALTQLSSQRPMENRIARTSPKDNIHCFKGSTIRDWTEGGLRAGARVTKRSRTTGWTDGTVNAIKSDLNMLGRENGQVSNPFGKEITAWAVHSPPTDGKFCSAGDSGALVNGWLMSIVGLLFGSQVDAGHGYVLPFDMVVGDIERVTGGKVVSPVKEQ